MSTSPSLTSTGLDNGTNTIINVVDPVNAQDAATKNFASNASNLTSGTLASARLPTSGVTAGTYNSVTVDATGRVTAGSVTGGSGVTIGTTAIAGGGTSTTLAGLTSVASAAFSITGGGPVLSSTGLDSKSNTLVNVADPVNAQDAATKNFASNASNLTTGTLNAALLPTSGVTAGTYNSVTVDATGRVTAASVASNGVTIGSTAIALGGTSTTLAGLTSVAATTFTGALTGNASTATKLATAQSISITGDATWTVNFDGSAAATGALTLATSGVTAGTYNQVTVDAKGRVTAATNTTGSTVNIVNNLTSTGTTQGGALAVTGDVNIITSPGTGTNLSPSGVILPNTTSTKVVNVYNNTNTNVNVYPYTSNVIDDQSANTPFLLPAFSSCDFRGMGNGNWLSSNTRAISGAGIQAGTIANAALTNSSVTLGSTAVALGATAASLAGLTSVTATTFTGALTGNASSSTLASTVTVAADSATNSSMSLLWANAVSGSLAVKTSTGATFNPSTGTITATHFAGDGSALTNLPGANLQAGTVGNSALTNNSMTLGSTTCGLGAIVSTLAGLTSVTAASFVGALTGNAATATAATNVAINVDSSTNAAMNVLWATGTTGNLPAKTSSSLTFNPSTGTLNATHFVGDGSGLTGITGGVVISTATPQANSGSGSAGSTGQVSDAGHVHPKLTAAAAGVVGIATSWNPTTNTPSLASGVAPSGNYNAFVASASATLGTAIDGITAVNTGDWLVFNTNTTTWNRFVGSRLTTTGTSLQKGDGSGNLTAAVVGTDYGAAPSLQSAIPIGIAPMGWVGPNGFWTIPAAWVFPSASTLTSQTQYYSTVGVWLYFVAGAIAANQPADFYFTKMGATGVMYGTLSGGSGYTGTGTYTNVPLTGGTGSGALANIIVSGGAVTRVVITHQGTGYTVNDVLSASNTNLGGAGTGFTYTVTVLNAYNTSTGITSLTINTAGSGLTNGTYTNIPLVSTQGSGVGGQVTVTVQGGAVVAVQVTVQGSGYSSTAGSSQLSVALSDLGGSGSAPVLQVATIGGGPMTGIIYNNLYTPGTNTGTWTTSNTSMQFPATPTPFSGTQGTYYSSAAGTNSTITLTAVGVTGGSLGNNGRMNVSFSHTAMSSSVAKSIQAGLGTAISGSVTNLTNIGTNSNITTTSHQACDSFMVNRGNQGFQYAPYQTIQAAGSSAVTLSSFNTATNFYIKTVAYINSGYTGVYATPQYISNAGSGYTNGTYTNVAIGTNHSGTGMTANVTIAGGAVTSFVITSFGSGYATGDSLTLPSGTVGSGTGFTCLLNGGAITAGGSAYTPGVYYNVPLTGGAGSGAVANITVNSSGVVSAITIVTPGTGYASTNTLSASTTYLGSGGSGFTYTVGTVLCAPDWTVQEYVSIVVTPQP